MADRGPKISRTGYDDTTRPNDQLQAVSPEFPLPVTDAGNKNAVSTTDFNSRASATLAAGATFQGVGEDVSAYGRAGVAITSSNATDGVLTMEVSHDGVTWGGPTRTWGDTRFGKPHMWNIVEKYFRIKYVNGTTEANDLSIQVQYSTNADIVLAHPLSEVLSNEDEAVLMRPGTDFYLDAARQHISGQAAEYFVGHNPSVGTSWEDVHPNGGDINWQTSSFSIDVVSTNVSDNGTTPGIGLHSVEIHGLSATGVDQDETILTNGTTPVAGALTYSRINIMHSEACGTYGGSHEGDITCEIVGGSVVMSKMIGQEGAVNTSVQYGAGESQNGYYTVPLGKVMYITQLEVIPDVSGNKTMDVVLYERENYLDVTTPFTARRELWSGSTLISSVRVPFPSHEKIKPLTDLWFRAKSSGGIQSLDVRLDYYLVDEDENGR